jgi:SAM-dependent methyltransferase
LTAGGSLEHFPETEIALREAHRVLKPGGILLGNVPYRYTLFIFAKFGQQAFGVWKCGYEKSFSISRWQRISADCGFGIRAVEISPYRAGKRRILGGMLELADRVTRKLGVGGHHIFFEALKPPSAHGAPLIPR